MTKKKEREDQLKGNRSKIRKQKNLNQQDQREDKEDNKKQRKVMRSSCCELL